MDTNTTLVIDEAKLAEAVQRKFTWVRVEPIISASVC